MYSLMYGFGLWVSEVIGLAWNDLIAYGDGVKCTVFSKGRKTRIVIQLI